jgi:deazaflavin-dependent oxidoreductase (nitroreductase family)
VRNLLLPLVVIGGLIVGVALWNRNTRIGAGFANDVVNPWLVQRGLSGSGERSEIATLEHVGRRSGTRRLTPLHVIDEADDVRFAVPLGERSEWARNVLAAGHCRMQFRDAVVELGEPRLLRPTEVTSMNPILARAAEWLGWEYLVLQRGAEQPGRLEVA